MLRPWLKKIVDLYRGWSVEDLVAAYEVIEKSDNHVGAIIFINKRQFKALIADEGLPSNTIRLFKRNHLNHLYEIRASKFR